MCDWLTLTFAAGISFCSSGRFENGCTPEKTDGIYMGIAPHIQLDLVPGREYYLLSDARCPTSADSVRLNGAAFLSNTSEESRASFDPWTASAFSTIGLFVPSRPHVIVSLPEAPRHERSRAVVCPRGDFAEHRGSWLGLLSLSAERTKSKLFSKTLVYPPLPIPIGMLVVSYLRQALSYKILLVIFFYADGIWWLANLLSSSELSEPTESLALPFLFCVSSFSLAFLLLRTRVSKNIFFLFALVPVALLTSPFYYTPLALTFAPVFVPRDRTARALNSQNDKDQKAPQLSGQRTVLASERC